MATTDIGNFFAIDRRTWAAVCDLGVNAAIAFLVIARGTGGDNRTSSWSVNAIEKYTSISRPRAVATVRLLVEKGFLTVLKGGTKPRYRIASPHYIASSAAFLTPPDVHLILSLINDPSPAKTGKAQKALQRLVDMGEVMSLDGCYYVAGHPDVTVTSWRPICKPDLIWLPNALVDGLSGETPPVELVRQTQDIHAIRMLGNVYYDQNLLANQGGEWRTGQGVVDTFERDKVGEYGQYYVWAFRSRAALAAHRSLLVTEHLEHCGLKDQAAWTAFWAAKAALKNAGLVEFVAHLVDARDGEIIHPMPTGGEGESAERALASAVHRAGCAMAKPGTDLTTAWAVVPVLKHIQNVDLVGIARPRYRPQTQVTKLWLGRAGELERWTKAYMELGDRALGLAAGAVPLATSRKTSR